VTLAAGRSVWQSRRASRRGAGWLAAGGVVFVVVLTLVTPEPAHAHCVDPANVGNLSKEEDEFKNWDYKTQNLDNCNVDWPVNFLFWNDASTTKVKNLMEPVGYDNTGDTFYTKISDNPLFGWQWDSDQGRKNYTLPDCIAGEMEHFRLYGAYGGQTSMYNMTWGHYVLGTSHIDHHECGSGSWSGESETAEHRIAEDVRRANGFGAVLGDELNFHNDVPTHTAEDTHHLESNGMATKARVS
jgi:hypothetical protein